MSYKSKRKIINSTVYIALALVIAAIMCITVMTFVNAYRNKSTPPVTTDDPAGITEDNSDAANADNSSGDIPTGGDETIKYSLPAHGYVMKEYSIDTPVYSLTMNDYRAHTGIDISAAAGEPVYAITGGVITDISFDPMEGQCITIEHSDGLISYYKNLSAEIPAGIAEGITVTAGQVIAGIGDTTLVELAETDHLHFELKKGNDFVNPLDYLDFSNYTNSDTPTNE